MASTGHAGFAKRPCAVVTLFFCQRLPSTDRYVDANPATQNRIAMPRRYQWLLFDVDDTLLDFQATETAAFARLLEQLGVAYAPEHRVRYGEINETLWRALERGEITQARLTVQRFEILTAELGLTIDAQRLSADYLEHIADCTTFVAGAREVIQALSRHYRIGIVSNGFKQIKYRQLANSGFSEHLEAILISEEVGAAKPHADFFDAAFAKIGQPSKDAVLIIGDSLSSDIVGGQAYGIDTCWYNPKQLALPEQPTPTYTIARLEQLLDLLS